MRPKKSLHEDRALVELLKDAYKDCGLKWCLQEPHHTRELSQHANATHYKQT